MKTATKQKVIAYIKTRGQARPHDLVSVLGISQVAVHKQLTGLIHEGILTKQGKPPLVFYTLREKTTITLPSEDISPSQKNLIDEHFLFITPYGKLLYGVEGFSYWAAHFQKGKPIQEVARLYEKTLDENARRPFGERWIDATEKMKKTFSDCQVDHLFLVDIYSYPIFGRTKLAKLVMYAKQTENKLLIPHIVSASKAIIEEVIDTFHIEAVAFIPPTVPRRIQLMSELERALHLKIPSLDIAKVIAGDIAIPQKTLPLLEDRIVNARSTMFVSRASHSYSKILLIDDVVGSGASFQEAARKLRVAGLGKDTLAALALVGNIKGFEVIREI